MWMGLLAWLCAAAAASPAERAPIRFAGLTHEADWPFGDPGIAGHKIVVDTLREGELVVADPGALDRGAARFTLSGALVRAAERSHLLFNEVELEIAWTLRDEATGGTVYRATTTGYAADRGSAWPRTVAYEALEDAASRLAAREPLRSLLEGVAAPPPPVVTDAAAIQVARCEASLPPMPRGLGEAAKAAVTVNTATGNSGSAFLVSPDGWALTAAHVVSQVNEVEVLLRNGPRLDAEVVRTHPATDVALLRIPGHAHPCVPLSSTPPELGADLFVLGSPLGAALDVSVTRGIVSGLRTFDGRRYLQTDAAVNPGSSGGPMLDEHGEVVALTSWKVIGEAEGLGFGVPIEAALAALGIRVGDASVVPPPVAPPVRPVTAIERVDDVADPTIRGEASRMGTLTPELERRIQGTGAGMVLGGLALGGIGVAMAATSYDTWTNDPAKSPGELHGAAALNATGWTAIAAGASFTIWGATLLGNR